MQDLTISITSHHDIEDCLLVQDEQNRSSINREAFVDQQKWFLYEHVATEMRQTQEEYSFDKEKSSGETKKHSVLSVTCRAGKHSWITLYALLTLRSFHSSSTRLLLLECILSDFSDHSRRFLYLFDHTQVRIRLIFHVFFEIPLVYPKIVYKLLVHYFSPPSHSVGSSIDLW